MPMYDSSFGLSKYIKVNITAIPTISSTRVDNSLKENKKTFCKINEH